MGVKNRNQNFVSRGVGGAVFSRRLARWRRMSRLNEGYIKYHTNKSNKMGESRSWVADVQVRRTTLINEGKCPGKYCVANSLAALYAKSL